MTLLSSPVDFVANRGLRMEHTSGGKGHDQDMVLQLNFEEGPRGFIFVVPLCTILSVKMKIKSAISSHVRASVP